MASCDMDSDEQARADERFEKALAKTGAPDPRDLYRRLLRELKAESEEAYVAAVARWQAEVVGPVAAGGEDPLKCWLGFGIALARELHPGRTVVVDDSGRAAPFEPPPSWEALILHLPENRKAKALAMSLPPEMSPAQRATVDLLVQGRNRLPDV